MTCLSSPSRRPRPAGRAHALYRRALQEFERAWARCATPRIAFNRARMLHQQLGRWPEAADWYQRAGRTAGDDAELSAKGSPEDS